MARSLNEPDPEGHPRCLLLRANVIQTIFDSAEMLNDQPAAQFIPTPDFRNPIPKMSINGFPTRFRRDSVNLNETLWVPQRVTRNRQSGGWQIDIQHSDGKLRLREGDRGRAPLESLEAAWQILTWHLLRLNSSYVDNRRVAPGSKRRIKELDTGVGGVLIARQRARNGRANTVSVRMFQRVETPNGKSRPVALDTVHISESKYLKHPELEQKRFEKGLCEAIAVRAQYLRVYTSNGPIPSPITVSDLEPESIPDQPTVPLDLQKMFATFTLF